MFALVKVGTKSLFASCEYPIFVLAAMTLGVAKYALSSQLLRMACVKYVQEVARRMEHSRGAESWRT